MDYVTTVLASAVVVHCESEGLRRKLLGPAAFHGNSISLAYTGKHELAGVLTLLQSLDVPFLSTGPTPSSDVFELLEIEGLVTGKVRHMTWRNPGEPVIYKK